MQPNDRATDSDHVKGTPESRVTLIEYADYQCPYCGEAYWALKRLHERYGDDLRLVFRNFPLTQIHPMAEPAAEAAEFAGENDRFWEMHDAIFENQQRLSTAMLVEVGEGLSLDPAALREAIETRRFHPKIHGDFMTGIRSGVNATPTFFINGLRLDGGVEDLDSAIYEALARRAA
jgi:protein-disulfide isomerase